MNGDVNGWHGAEKVKNDFNTIDKTPFTTSFSLVVTSVDGCCGKNNQCRDRFREATRPRPPDPVDLGNEAEEQNLSSAASSARSRV